MILKKLVLFLRLFCRQGLKRGVAQLVAYLVWDQRVVSSSLATPTLIIRELEKFNSFFISLFAYYLHTPL